MRITCLLVLQPQEPAAVALNVLLSPYTSWLNLLEVRDLGRGRREKPTVCSLWGPSLTSVGPNPSYYFFGGRGTHFHHNSFVILKPIPALVNNVGN